MIWDTRTIRESDEQGLKRAGLSWVERRPMPLMVMSAIASVLLLFGAFSIYRGEVTTGILAVILMFVSVWAGYQFYPVRRSLLFDRDGSILAPRGLPYYGRRVLRQWGTQYIQTIEVLDVAEVSVNIGVIATTGETLYVARDLPPSWARQVVVKLTLALEAIREAVREQTLAAKPDHPGGDDLIE